MNLERLDRKDFRLIAICAAVAILSLWVGVTYFFKAFPEAQIEFKTTRKTSLPIAQNFLSKLDLPATGYRHASIFGFDDDAKTFLEREVGAEESGRLLDGPIRLWRWQHRWFKPLQKEELQISVTTRGEVVAFQHLLKEEEKGADLAPADARARAETFLTRVMGRKLEALAFVEGAVFKRPHRTDHTFTWKLKDLEIKGADYRVQVSVGGDRVIGYDEGLHIPDAWTEGYKKLRSRNETAGLVDAGLLLLTMVAMITLLVMRIRRGDVKWFPAGVIGAVACVLSFLSAMNNLPANLYAYDTTTSLPGHLLLNLIIAVLSSLATGSGIFLLVASAEPLYRERFPRFLSLSALVRPRAFRTKPSFIALMVGLTLTCFFFAYENVFYIIANRLGAWSPRDIAYSDLLSTSFPWIYVLFIGWLPAILEEFMSRAFSIPFLERAGAVLRLPRALHLPLAIVVSAFVWGFGHAAYPNQPWWIRGLEVGLAGIVFGLVLLRFGILAVVTCHFTVDALYTAFGMIRSGDPYYVVTGSLSTGVFAILFLIAGAFYLARGGFLPAEETNAAEGVAPPLPPSPVSDDDVRAVARYRPLTVRILVVALLATVIVALLALPRVDRFGDWSDAATTKDHAKEVAGTFLRSCGFDVGGYQVAAMPLERTDRTAGAYLLQKAGLSTTKEVYRERVPTPLWRVRFYIPEKQEEYSVSVDAAKGTAVGFSRTLPDDAPGATLEEPQALAVAETFVAARGQDPRKGELKEQTHKDEKARRDHTLTWEYPIAGADEAKVRYVVVVQGDAVGSWTRAVKIPEDWEREYEKTTALKVVLQWLWLPVIGLMSGMAVVLFVRVVLTERLPWRFALIVGAVAGVAGAAAELLGLEAQWANPDPFGGYQTSTPAELFSVGQIVGVLVRAVFISLVTGLLVALAGALYPQARATFKRVARRAYALDALVAGLVAVGLGAGLRNIGPLLASLIPDGVFIQGVPMPAPVVSSLPYLYALGGVVRWSAPLAAAAAVLAALFVHFFRNILVRVAIGLFAAVAFFPKAAVTLPEALGAVLGTGVTFLAAFLFVRYVLRDNPLAWLWTAWLALGVSSAASLIAQSAPLYRTGGFILLAFVLAPGLVLVADAIGGRGERRTQASTTT